MMQLSSQKISMALRVTALMSNHVIGISTDSVQAGNQNGNNDGVVRTHEADADLLSRVVGVPGVWWPASHLVSSAWSLLAAGLSTAVVGASFLPQLRRSDQVSERIYRGVVAKPHSWPWIAKLKVRMSL